MLDKQTIEINLISLRGDALPYQLHLHVSSIYQDNLINVFLTYKEGLQLAIALANFCMPHIGTD